MYIFIFMEIINQPELLPLPVGLCVGLWSSVTYRYALQGGRPLVDVATLSLGRQSQQYQAISLI